MYLLIKSFCEKQKEDEQKKLLRKDSIALLKDFERIINFNEDESDEESDKIDNLEPKRDAQIINFANIFGWDIDFALDIRAGDSFHMIYEKKYIHFSIAFDYKKSVCTRSNNYQD